MDQSAGAIEQSQPATYSFGLSSLLLWRSVRVEGEGSDTGVLGGLDNQLLSIVGRDGALRVCGGLDSSLRLELAGFFGGRHVAKFGAGQQLSVFSRGSIDGIIRGGRCEAPKAPSLGRWRMRP